MASKAGPFVLEAMELRYTVEVHLRDLSSLGSYTQKFTHGIGNYMDFIDHIIVSVSTHIKIS